MAVVEEHPVVEVGLEQADRYEFRASFPGMSFPAWLVDEPPPLGGARGPNPSRTLAVALGHCLSSSLFYGLERARVASSPIRTRVRVDLGRNDRGRLRVRTVAVEIEAAPLRPEDRERFDHVVSIFEDYCTVSAAVREGIRVTARVRPPTGSGSTDPSVPPS